MHIDKKPNFTFIDVNNWPRKPYFDHYYNKVKCTRSITADIDIGFLLKICKERSIKLYPAMIHIIARAVNQMEELRTSYNEHGELGTWDFMSPCYTVFHNDEKIFSNIWTTYSEAFSDFNRDYLVDIETYGAVKNFMAKGDVPGNTFPVSCLPWIDFTGYNLNIYDDARYLCPIFTFGKYTVKEGKTVIPLCALLHHALCDGYHAGVLFQLIREIASKPDEWIVT
ncbi:MAG: CatA-like O-acetyltransferase [Gammaproteobacteria bacterium]